MQLTIFNDDQCLIRTGILFILAKSIDKVHSCWLGGTTRLERQKIEFLQSFERFLAPLFGLHIAFCFLFLDDGLQLSVIGHTTAALFELHIREGELWSHANFVVTAFQHVQNAVAVHGRATFLHDAGALRRIEPLREASRLPPAATEADVVRQVPRAFGDPAAA